MWSQDKLKHRSSETKSYSIRNVLRKEGRSNLEFENMMKNISLEELIALKLELSVRSVGNKLFGLPIYTSFAKIARQAVLMFAVSVTRNKTEAGHIIGLNRRRMFEYCQNEDIKDYFESKKEESSSSPGPIEIEAKGL